MATILCRSSPRLAKMDISRRVMLAGMATTTLASSRLIASAGAPGGAVSDLRAAARETYLFTLPLIRSARLRARSGPSAINALDKVRGLMTPATQRVTTVNNDTINARGWIDLSGGPAYLSIPATGDRYLSAALMDMYTNNFAILGSRTTGPGGGQFKIVGPQAPVEEGVIHAPTRWILVVVRLLTTGGDDLPEALALQDRISVETTSRSTSSPQIHDADNSWSDFLSLAATLLKENPPAVTDWAVLDDLRRLHLDDFDASRFGAVEEAEIIAGFASAQQMLEQDPVAGPVEKGWAYPRPTFGDWKQDYAYRAQIAMSGYGGLPVEEAIYVFSNGPEPGQRYDASGSWRMRLPMGGVPVNAFWSLTIYRATPDGQFFLFDNPINRYSIGDRTPGLVTREDGMIEIAIQPSGLPATDGANWLPSPGEGRFGLVFRGYWPHPEMIDGRWRLPPVERIG